MKQRGLFNTNQAQEDQSFLIQRQGFINSYNKYVKEYLKR